MPITIEGWIEFSPYIETDERDLEHSWIAWMKIEAIISYNDEINCLIIGNPRDFDNNDVLHVPIAKNRGFPNNPSSYLKSNIDSLIDFEEMFGQGEIFGFTHFYFSEVEGINWFQDYGISIVDTEWEKLFDLTVKFKDIKSINSNQIRFTLWYNW